MINEVLKEKYNNNEPIFTREILSLFPSYSRQYINEKLNEEVNKGEIISYKKGVYYLPKISMLGESHLSFTSVIEKKYISDGDSIYGFYSGLTLLNSLGLTSQMAHKREIVSSKEHSKKRVISYKGYEYTLRKARCEITKENIYAYIILEVFTITSDDEIKGEGLGNIKEYINEHHVSRDDINKLVPSFPAKVARRLLLSEVLR